MYGLIGKPLTHSFSADFFNKKFLREGISESYLLFPLSDIRTLPTLLKKNPELNGLNVTLPYKQSVIPFLDDISDEAGTIGAVNVIKISRNSEKNHLTGFNTDVIGFENSLKPLLTPDISGALILGTGGASKAVAHVLKKLEIPFLYVSRNHDRGDIGYDEIDKEVIKEHQLIVNTTPLGMFPDINKAPPIPYEFLTKKHFCYDLIYNPEETIFMKKSKEYGARTKNGEEMLRLQALASWDIWNSDLCS